MSEEVIISIKLCNRTYRVKSAAKNEATVRATVQEIIGKINDLKKNFPGRDDQDYMAMTLIDHLTSSKNPQPLIHEDTTEIQKNLDSLNQLLDS